MASSSRILEALITVVVSLALLPVVRDFVATAIPNSTTSETVLLGLISLFWIIATVALVAKMMGVGSFGRR